MLQAATLGPLLFQVSLASRAPIDLRSDLESCVVLGEIPTYILNLDRRVDRLHDLSEVIETRAPWLSACRVRAPEGRRLKEWSNISRRLATAKVVREAAERRSKTVGTQLTKGALALIFGHGLIWEHIAQQAFPFAVVMEDDIQYLHKDLGNFLCRLAHGDFEPKWDYIQLQHGGELANGTLLGIVNGSDYNTGMYIMTREAALKMLDSQFPVGKSKATAVQLDTPEGPLRTELRTFMTEPPAATQVGSDMDSDVQILEDSSFVFVTRIADCASLNSSRMRLPELQSVL